MRHRPDTTATDPSPPRAGSSAIVIGASMAGLSAARVLSERFDGVLVLDRDRLPTGSEPRGHVPQGRHPHLLWVTGARRLEGWFPGLVADLEAGGAVELDVVGDFYWHQGGGVARRPATALRGPAMSRPFLDNTVRRHLETRPNVTIRDEVGVVGLDVDATATRVVGVRLDDGTAVPCDLVVDATGRRARSLPWVEELGYAAPPVSRVAVDTRYVSCAYRRTDDPARDWKAAAVIGDPDTKRLTMLLPMEGDRWILSVSGVNGESPPSDHAGMLAYARSLASPVVADTIEGCEPLGAPATYRFPANQRRHVERLRRFPLGWVLLGDAVCSFNPIYGQGMTSAVQQAVALGEQLDRSGAVDRRFSRRCFRAFGRVVDVPWSVAVGGDFAYEATVGRKPFGTDLANRWFDHVTIAGQHDDEVVTRFNEVLGFLRRPAALMAPAFAVRVMRASRRGPTGVASGAGSGERAGAPADDGRVRVQV